MPNTAQAKKRMRQDEKRRLQNRSLARSMRTTMRKVLRAGAKQEAEALLPEAMKRIDKAAKSNVIHSNAAARYKSRLQRNVAAR